MKFYAGVGSRETPAEILRLMTLIAERLELAGYVLRSGGARGADAAFKRGASKKMRRIYLPWEEFGEANKEGIVVGRVPSLRDYAKTYHPAWHRLTPAAEKLMTRNVAQVLGYPPEPERSEFVVCWTPEGKGGGGTGQAIRIARAYQIPIYDLALEERRYEFMKFLGGL